MNIIILGCGRVGSDLANRLYQRGHAIAVIDQAASAFANLSPSFGGRTIEGEVLSREVLHRAGIETAEALAAVTNSDSTNAVVAHVARTTYHVPRVVCRSYDPRRMPIHQAFGIEMVSSSSWGAQRIEELITTTAIHPVFSAGSGEVEIYEFHVPKHWSGKRLKDLLPDTHCRPAAHSRAGRALLPDPQMHLEAGDTVLVAATPEGMQVLRERLAADRKGG